MAKCRHHKSLTLVSILCAQEVGDIAQLNLVKQGAVHRATFF